MNIKTEYPPNNDQIAQAFNLRGRKPVFCYGDTLYNPHEIDTPQHLIVHESVHVAQQAAIGGPKIWWDKYIGDVLFRLNQEVEAYHAQYEYARTVASRNNVRAFLNQIAADLSGPIYGHMITHAAAKVAIKTGKI